jgi:hypothetical protein
MLLVLSVRGCVDGGEREGVSQGAGIKEMEVDCDGKVECMGEVLLSRLHDRIWGWS